VGESKPCSNTKSALKKKGWQGKAEQIIPNFVTHQPRLEPHGAKGKPRSGEKYVRTGTFINVGRGLWLLQEKEPSYHKNREKKQQRN